MATAAVTDSEIFMNRLADHSSIFTAEAKAISLALEHIPVLPILTFHVFWGHFDGVPWPVGLAFFWHISPTALCLSSFLLNEFSLFFVIPLLSCLRPGIVKQHKTPNSKLRESVLHGESGWGGCRCPSSYMPVSSHLTATSLSCADIALSSSYSLLNSIFTLLIRSLTDEAYKCRNSQLSEELYYAP